MRILILLFFFIPISLFSQEKSEAISPCVSEIFVPNNFSGNGDGVNDIFLPRLAGEPFTYTFKIFNRWGEIIFETKNVTEGWTGYYKDRPVESDVFVWMIEFTCEGSDEKYKFTGNVTLIR